MHAIIIAGGKGKRMLPLTLDTPKSLLKISGKTFLDHIFEALPKEVNEVTLAVRYLAEKIKEHCGSEFYGKKIYYVEDSGKGSADGLMAARKFVKPGERIMIIYGDELITPGEIKACTDHEFSWLCYEVPEPEKSGIATLDEEGRVLGVIEKPENPASNLAAVGLMIANDTIFNYSPELGKNGEYYLSSMMSQFCKDNRVMAVRGMMQRPQFTTPEDLIRLEEMLRRKNQS